MNVAELQRGAYTYRLMGLFLSLLALVTLLPARASTQAPDNPIVLENQQPGSNGWMWTNVGDDVNQQIKGYASATSVNQNENITFYVSVNPAQNYSIDFYRFGWYGGLGGRLRLHVGPIAGIQQATCPVDGSTGMIACDWMPSYTLTVPGDWTSGVYAALLINAQGFKNYVIFVVKDGRAAPFLYQQGINTDEAYNNYPNNSQTGKSLYPFNSFGANTVSGNTSAVKVSFDRPMADSGLGNFHKWEVNFIRWLERSGYDVTYSTDIDTHTNGAALLGHQAFLIAGHDEYWSKEMRDAVEAARDGGVDIGVFAANTSYTQVRLESSATGAPNRVIVEYRNFPWAPTDPVQGPTTTTDFRLPPVNRPEQTLLGGQFISGMPNSNFVVTNSSHWVYTGTGFNDGDAVPGLLGYEGDAFMSNYPGPNSTNFTLLSRSPFQDWSGATLYANSSIYQAPSGAWVFNAGTISWSWGLDDVPGPTAQFKVDARIQRTTKNILDAFLNGVVAPPPPTITSFTPTSGPVGTSVTINGTNLSGITAVTVNGTAAAFTVQSATAIQATVPAGATTGPLGVSGPAGSAISATNFTVTHPPTITSFSPTSGPAGLSVTLGGTNFTGTTAVTFNGTAAAFTVLSATAIQATAPAGATTGPLGVTTPDGTATSATNFTVTHPPTITSFSPTSATGGTGVTISGTFFTGTTAVAFNGTSAAFTVTSDTAIVATVPVTAASGPLSVTTPDGTATSADSFGVAPAITSFTPTGGAVGTVVTINGTNFTGASTVAFNGTAASFTVTSAAAITATVPAGATTGPLSVTTAGGTSTGGSNFTVIHPPAIASFTPTSGSAGTVVTIDGTNFTGASTVAFNGTAASFTVTSATTIQATLPADATTGPISVTTVAGTATSAGNFAVVPTITSFTPTSGAVGIAVTINGANFTGASSLAFNGTAASFSVTSATAIQATVPADATTGPLSVTTAGGTATSGTSFVVAPRITTFTPASGPSGTVVTISGANFTGATAVKFNGANASSFTVTSATAIQATVPTNATTGPLSVTTAAGVGTSGASFAVVPTITSFTPPSGPVGTVVTLSGANFTGATAVKFNGLNASSFIVTSATAIQATAPAGMTTGPLSVTTPGGTATSAANFVAAPTIASFSPVKGAVDSVVTISGLNFTGATAVKFNGVSATNFAVTSATAIQAVVPTGATTGLVSVTTPAGTAASATNFTVTAVLTVRKTSGPIALGNGTITSSPAGINCGPTCSGTYDTVTVVTLTATADVLSVFNGWTGCDTVNGNVCTVTMDRAKSVVANFLP